MFFLSVGVIALSPAMAEEDTPPEEKIRYVKLPDPFHINLEDGHIMRIRVTLASYSKDLIQDIQYRKKLYIPLRHELHKYFTKNTTYDEVRYAIGKDQLAIGALKVVQDYLNIPEGEQGITNLFFEEIIIQ